MDTKDRNRPVKRKNATARTGAGRTATATGSRNAREVQRRATQRRREQAKPTPEVVYTQPDPFNRKRFLLYLVTVAAVVLALVFGMSIFFKVDADKITVSGMDKYTAWQVREASGIQDGENLLALSDARIGGRIQAALPYVKDVRVGIKLPDTVLIEIVEMQVVYSAEAEDGSWWLMSSDGILVEHTNGASAGEHTKLLGVKLTAPQIGVKAVAAEPVPTETAEDGTLIPVTVLGRERLDAAISILQYLEDSGILGQAASVDVSDMTRLEVWYGKQYQVNLGDTTQLKYKVSLMKKAIDQMGEYHEGGQLDVSFSIRPNEAVFTKFE